jgi:hypothetical protein
MDSVIHIEPNQQDATKRRVGFLLHDIADGRSPRLDKAGAQPYISVDFGTPTTTGIGTLVYVGVAPGGALYYATLTLAILATPGQVIRTGFGDDDTLPEAGETVVVSPFFSTVASEIRGTVIATVSPTTTVFEASDIVEATTDHFKNQAVRFTKGALLGQSAVITAYSLVSGRGRFTVSPAMTDAPAAGDTFVVI